MKNFVFYDTIKVCKIRLFDIFTKKVYFHGLPGIYPVLNNFKAFVRVLIYHIWLNNNFLNDLKLNLDFALNYGPCNYKMLCKR